MAQSGNPAALSSVTRSEANIWVSAVRREPGVGEERHKCRRRQQAFTVTGKSHTIVPLSVLVFESNVVLFLKSKASNNGPQPPIRGFMAVEHSLACHAFCSTLAAAGTPNATGKSYMMRY